MYEENGSRCVCVVCLYSVYYSSRRGARGADSDPKTPVECGPPFSLSSLAITLCEKSNLTISKKNRFFPFTTGRRPQIFMSRRASSSPALPKTTITYRSHFCGLREIIVHECVLGHNPAVLTLHDVYVAAAPSTQCHHLWCDLPWWGSAAGINCPFRLAIPSSRPTTPK